MPAGAPARLELVPSNPYNFTSIAVTLTYSDGLGNWELMELKAKASTTTAKYRA